MPAFVSAVSVVLNLKAIISWDYILLKELFEVVLLPSDREAKKFSFG
jgi:hypothetical protein